MFGNKNAKSPVTLGRTEKRTLSYTFCFNPEVKSLKNPVYQLFLYFLFWTRMSEIKSSLYFSFNL